MMYDSEVHRRHRRRIFSRMRSNFLTGLVVIAPIGLTAWLVWKIIGWIDGIVLPFVPYWLRPDQYVGFNLKGIGLIIFLIFTVLIGWAMKGLIGRTFLGWGERLVDRTPFVRTIYSGVKQIAETVFSQADTTNRKVCLIEYPRKGSWGIGFITSEAKGVIRDAVPEKGQMVTVFVPTTPNPTSGYLLIVPRADIIEIAMTLEEATKVVVSGGMVTPPSKELKQIVTRQRRTAKPAAPIEVASSGDGN